MSTSSLAAALTLTSWAVLWPAGPSASAVTCTIVGTPKADTLTGTSGNDVICGLGGNDVINGNGGDDTIDGGSGDDRINGGAGDDKLMGGDGNDTIIGGTGDDDMSGGAGTDTVSYADHTTAVTANLDGVRNDGSSTEKDYITVSVENLTGGSGDDTLTGSAGANVLTGGGGDDVLVAGGGNDRLTGGTGDDKLTGGSGADTIDGNAGTNLCDEDPADASVLHCSADSTAPALKKYTLSTKSVDTSAGAKTVTATIDVTDDFSGVASVTAKLVGPATYTKDATLKSGNAMSGTYEAVFTVPKAAPKGSYALQVGATDKKGNTLAPKDTSLTVEQTGEGDKTPPALTKWTIDKTSVDPADAAEDVTVTADVSDGGSGVATVKVSLVGPATYAADATRKSGDEKAGTYSAVVSVPKGAASGSYKVVVKATDAKGNVLEKEVTTLAVGSGGGGGEPSPGPAPGGSDTTDPFVASWSADALTIDTDYGPEEEEAPGGEYKLYVGATDAAGNVAEPKATNIVVTNEAQHLGA